MQNTEQNVLTLTRKYQIWDLLKKEQIESLLRIYAIYSGLLNPDSQLKSQQVIGNKPYR